MASSQAFWAFSMRKLCTAGQHLPLTSLSAPVSVQGRAALSLLNHEALLVVPQTARCAFRHLPLENCRTVEAPFPGSAVDRWTLLALSL